jgi:hypothetical protein
MKIEYRMVSAAALALCAWSTASAQVTEDDMHRLYISVSGLWVDQGDADFDVDDLFDDGEWTFDDGWGVAVAIGQSLADSPFRLEF